MNLETQSRQTKTASTDCSINGSVLQKLNHLEEILNQIREESPEGFDITIEQVKSMREKYKKEEEIIDPMIHLLAGLDNASICLKEKRTNQEIARAIAESMEIMKLLGAEPLPAERGTFDNRIHWAVGARVTSEVPDRSIADVVFRGFKVGKKTICAKVIVGINPKKSGIGQCQQEEAKTQPREEKTTRKEEKSNNKLREDCSPEEKILPKLEYLSDILSEIKRKNPAERSLVKDVESIKEMRQQKEDIVLPMIQLLAGLDRAYECSIVKEKQEAIGKGVVLSLEIMKQMDAKLLRAEKGEQFDDKIHRVVGIKELALPEGTILGVLSRGFQIGEKIYPAHVIVSKNEQKAEQKRSSSGEQKHTSTEGKLQIPSHEQYQEYVRECFRRLGNDPFAIKWIKKHHERLLDVFMVNFDPIIEKVTRLYSPDKRGKPPCDPIATIRSLMLMPLFKETSIPEWVTRMQTNPLLAIVAGFKPGNTPAVGTYYTLFQRLENGPYRPKCPHRILASEQRQAILPYRLPKEKPKEEVKKNSPPETGVLKKLREKLQKEEKEPVANDLERTLNEILLEVAVIPSASKKLLGDIEKMTVCADGSTLPSGASPNGKRTCDCKSEGIYRCEHLRKFSDMVAAWGWDNRVKDWIFGYRYYQLNSPVKRHDLPLYLSMAPANKHEAVMSLIAMERFRKQNEVYFPLLKIRRFSGDAIHDAYAYYRYLVDHDILYAIPYSKAPASCFDLNGNGQLFNEKGIPFCPGGLPMRRMNRSPQGHIIYACPIKRPTNRKEGRNLLLVHRDECPREALCEPDSRWGPYVRVRAKDDPRIHPLISRDSKEFLELKNLRSSSERTNSMKKQRYLLKRTKSRVMPYVFIRTVLASILEHSRVWVQEKLKNIAVTAENLFSLFD